MGMNKKKARILLLSFVIVLLLFGCSKSVDVENKEKNIIDTKIDEADI
jgi:outer membrane biogenesis lipoprotein LolB